MLDVADLDRGIRKQVVDQAIDGVVIIDDRNCIIYFNAAAERLWGHSAADVLGQNVKMLIPSDMRQNHDAWVNRHRRDGQDRIVGSAREVQMERADGRRV